MPEIPAFNSEFLQELADGLRKRRRAISHKVSDLDFQRVIERSHSGSSVDDHEKFEIQMHLYSSGSRPLIRFFAWHDRLAFVDARQHSKSGWLWQWTREGRLLGSVTARVIVDALEETLACCPDVDGKGVTLLDNVWLPLFAAKPKLVS